MKAGGAEPASGWSIEPSHNRTAKERVATGPNNSAKMVLVIASGDVIEGCWLVITYSSPKHRAAPRSLEVSWLTLSDGRLSVF